MNKKQKISILLIILIIIFLIFLYHFRYAPFFYLQRLYEYRINNSIQAGDFTKAEKLYKKKLTFCITNFSKESTINAMIRFYINQRMYKEAEKLYLEKIKNDILYPVWGCGNGNSELDLGDLYNSMAILYLNMGKLDKALEFTNSALKIFDNQKEQSHIFDKYIKSYEILSLIHTSSQNYKKAQEYSEKTKYYAQKANKGEEAFFDYYNTKIQYYSAIKKYDKAEDYVKKMYTAVPSTTLPLSLQSQVSTQNNYIVFINNHLGKTYYLQDKYKDAERVLSIAYKISHETNGEFHPDTICNNYYLTHIYKKQGRNELFKHHIRNIKRNIQKYKILKNIDSNFDENMKKFCNTY